jgi:hypothetical protein
MVRAVEDARNLPSEHRNDGLRLALAARYAAHKGWIHSELARYAAVKPAKVRSDFNRGRAIIYPVTIHDSLSGVCDRDGQGS